MNNVGVWTFQTRAPVDRHSRVPQQPHISSMPPRKRKAAARSKLQTVRELSPVDEDASAASPEHAKHGSAGPGPGSDAAQPSLDEAFEGVVGKGARQGRDDCFLLHGAMRACSAL